MGQVRLVDPRTLILPPPRAQGADPAKSMRQVSRFGAGVSGMPPLLAGELPDGRLVLTDGVTRATRAAKYAPGTAVPVEVIGAVRLRGRVPPAVGDVLP